MEHGKILRLINEFNGLDQHDKDEIMRMLKADDMASALWEIHEQVFRPSWKHGYPDQALQELIDKNDDSYEIIEKLHDIFMGILSHYQVDEFLP